MTNHRQLLDEQKTQTAILRQLKIDGEKPEEDHDQRGCPERPRGPVATRSGDRFGDDPMNSAGYPTYLVNGAVSVNSGVADENGSFWYLDGEIAGWDSPDMRQTISRGSATRPRPTGRSRRTTTTAADRWSSPSSPSARPRPPGKRLASSWPARWT